MPELTRRSRPSARWQRLRRPVAVAAGLGLLFLASCSIQDTTNQIQRLGLPAPASNDAIPIGDLWIGTWIAAGVVGILVWGLIGWAARAVQAARTNYMPRQNRYNLPMEIMYTIVPFVIIGVLFYYTIVAQNKVLGDGPGPGRDDRRRRSEVVVDVQLQVGRRSRGRARRLGGRHDQPDARPVSAGRQDRSSFNLSSPDVIHSFWIPAFYQKLDVVPGRRQQLLRHADQGGRVRRQVRRAVRHLPLGDAVQRPHRERGGVQRRT